MPNYKKVKLSAIHEDESNARLHPDENLSDIRASLIEFGQVEPLVVQKSTGKIIGGNGRYQVMKSLEWKECDVVYVDVDNTKSTALGIALNRAGERAEWDDDVLAGLLSDIDGEVGEELQLSLKDLEESLEVDLPEVESDAPPQIDRAKHLHKKWGTKKGQLWLIGDHRLLCGDSTDRGDVEKVMAGKKAYLMATDPPYGVDFAGAKYNPRAKEWEGIEGDKVQGDDLRAFICTMLKVWFPNIEEQAAFYLWSAAMSEGAAAAAGIKDSGLHIQSQIIWKKNCLVLGQADYHWMHENCWYAFFKGKKHRWYGERDKTTVWEVDKIANASYIHPMQKPTELYSIPMQHHTLTGDVVAEPFAGSGSQYVAAQNLNRKCYGIEISPAYCAVILERMKTAFPNLVIKKQ